MNLITHESYDEYVNIQRQLTAKRTDNGRNILTWVSEDMLSDINKVLHSYVSDIKTMVCHGCRNGFEVNILQNLNPDAKVFGTDIYGLAYRYDRTYFREMDFDTVPEDWKEYFDVVYSNAIDHSRNPINTLLAWKSELKMNGVCFVAFHWSKRHGTKADCFNLSFRKPIHEIWEIVEKIGMKILYTSEPDTVNRGRAYYANVILSKI